MKIANSIFNIRIISSEGIPSPLRKEGMVTILGSPKALGNYAHRLYNDILQGIDIKATFYRYDLSIKEEYSGLDKYLECNLIAPLPNLVTGEIEMIIATAQPEDLGLAAVAIMNEIENRTRNAIESTIALFALGAPDEYRFAVEILFNRLSRSNNYNSRISFKGRSSSKTIGRLGYLPAQTQEDAFRKISDKDIREVYDNLPDRYSDLYEKRNPDAAQVVRYSLGVIDQQSLVALLVEAAKTDKRLLQKLQNAKRKMAAKYGLKVKQWSSDQKKNFKDQYRFCLYIIDEKGNEKPVKFKNNPSYCIFMMYVLDRFSRGVEATSLSFKENEEEFKRLYRSIFNEDYEQIDSFCEEMIHRPTNVKGIVRKGRFDDYIKDINDTMDELVGCPDSISLKVGHGQFLEIPQQNIEIDRNLPFFKFI
ncbi:MAG: hypothetical protein K2I69_07445 [Muribaculaceae bacterium]|nr:hypothetical protein [Muribaculaceae bacterium]